MNPHFFLITDGTLIPSSKIRLLHPNQDDTYTVVMEDDTEHQASQQQVIIATSTILSAVAGGAGLHRYLRRADPVHLACGRRCGWPAGHPPHLPG